jgi:hypothetical protein
MAGKKPNEKIKKRKNTESFISFLSICNPIPDLCCQVGDDDFVCE